MGHQNSRRMLADEDSSVSTSSSDEGSDLEDQREYAVILQSLIDSFFYSEQYEATGYREDFQEADLPKIRFKPNTDELDRSEFSQITKQSSGVVIDEKKKSEICRNMHRMVLNREIGRSSLNGGFSHKTRCRLSNQFLPNKMTVLDNYPGKVFCGTFSNDGEQFITASQDRQIRIYNSDRYPYKLCKTMRGRDVGWSVIDVAFSPNRENFVYSSWSSSLHLCPTDPASDHQEPLCLTLTGRRFCVFSVLFSSDGRELLGGANDGFLYVYDMERHARTLKIPAHEYDVNSIAWAESDGGSHILYSGGDDGLVKIWDRRALDESSCKPVGVLAGHMDGITHVDSRGDGRHLISNCKDQTIKLWDVRRPSDDRAAKRSLLSIHEQGWDYRWQEVPRRLYNVKRHLDGDTSIMTYRGHVVVKTLVRCRFSPAATTGQRFIYTGCGLGRVVIYDTLTGRICQDRKKHFACVRDVHWHPHRTELLSSSWDGTVGLWTHDRPEYSLDGPDLPCDETDNWEKKEDWEKKSSSHQQKKKKTEPLRRSARLAKKEGRTTRRTRNSNR